MITEKTDFSFCLRILVAKQAVRRFILLNGGKTTHGRIETVIRGIIVAL